MNRITQISSIAAASMPATTLDARRSRTAARARIARFGVALLVVAGALAACSSTGGPGRATASPAHAIEVTGAWSKASATMAGAGTAYAVIRNTGTTADALIGAESAAATRAGVSETYVIESPAASGDMAMGSPAASDGGATGSPVASAPTAGSLGMRPISRVEIPAGASVELRPGGYHVMLVGLKEDLVPGATIELTLVFEKAGRITVTADVRSSAATSPISVDRLALRAASPLGERGRVDP